MARIPDGYVTMKQVMAKAGVKSRKQIREDIEEGLLPLNKIPSQSKLFLFKEEEANQYIEEYHKPHPYSKKCG